MTPPRRSRSRLRDTIRLTWPLLLVWAAAMLLVMPTINRHVDDPNMIVYVNNDEGGLMDLIWWYYSGEQRASMYYDFDYGLEMVYLAGLARLVPPQVVEFTPGRLALIFRWLHFASWLGARRLG